MKTLHKIAQYSVEWRAEILRQDCLRKLLLVEMKWVAKLSQTELQIVKRERVSPLSYIIREIASLVCFFVTCKGHTYVPIGVCPMCPDPNCRRPMRLEANLSSNELRLLIQALNVLSTYFYNVMVPVDEVAMPDTHVARPVCDAFRHLVRNETYVS